MLTEYLQGIYCCDINTSLDKQIYAKYNINIVINCTIDYDFLDLDIKKIRVPLSQDMNFHTDIQLLNKNMSKLLNIINNNYIDNNILFCCYDGISISPLIIGLFIHKFGNIPLNQIKDILKSKNNKICIDYDMSIFRL